MNRRDCLDFALRHGSLAAAALCGLPARAQSVAAPAAPGAATELRAELGEVRLQGQGRLRFFGLHVYDIRLWAGTPVAEQNWASQALALEIEYARGLVGEQIAERSLAEMKRQPGFDAKAAPQWLLRMKALFPDVKAGDRITGVQRAGEATRFFVNGRPAGEVRDALFTRLFFGIWLAPETSEPAMRQQLFGLSR